MEYIYTSPSLSTEMCKKIIELYEKDTQLKYDGVIGIGVNKNIKHTTDLIIPFEESWEDINKYLNDELQKHVKIYINGIEDKPNFKGPNNYGMDYQHLDYNLVQLNNFHIQKYDKQVGKYVYHDDYTVINNHSRSLTYLWYLNDVDEGGETEFFGGSHHIKPETGKLLLFPSVWCFPHRGNMPISSCKYIVTGWLYQEISTIENRIPNIKSLETPEILSKKCTMEAFNYFYRGNKSLFKSYKYSTGIENICLSTYTPLMSNWILKKIKGIKLTEIDNIPEIVHFCIQSFNLIVDFIKDIYKINANFNIKKWLVLHRTDKPLFDDIEYDLCIQTDLYDGKSYIGKKMNTMDTEYQLLYLIEYNFIYMDNKNEKTILTLKEIAEPFLDEIR